MHLQNITPSTALGREIRNRFTEGMTLPSCDTSDLERRLMADDEDDPESDDEPADEDADEDEDDDDEDEDEDE